MNMQSVPKSAYDNDDDYYYFVSLVNMFPGGFKIKITQNGVQIISACTQRWQGVSCNKTAL